MWAKAVAVRKGLIHIDHVKKVTRDTLKQCFDASPAKSFSGTLNEKHMMVVVSADLCLEEKSGWLAPPTGKLSGQAEGFRERCRYALQLASQSQSTLAFLFDGRSREVHRMPEPQLSNCSVFQCFSCHVRFAICQSRIDEICNATKIDTCQLYLTYRGKINKTTTRKVFGSQMNCESCFVALSVPRVRLSTVDRKDLSFFNFSVPDC